MSTAFLLKIENGRPANHPSDLLKLFIYVYMNKVRHSRDLEKECRRTRALAENDGDNRKQIKAEIKKQEDRKAAYRELENQLKESGQAQISLSDPESRQIMVSYNITEVSYNVQSTVDAKKIG